MNIFKLVTPDFVIGKILSVGKSVLDILLLLIRKPSKKPIQFAWLILQVKPKYTMLSTYRLINLYDLVQESNALDLSGDIVECGVWNGGSAAIMGVACRDDKTHFKTRKIWLFDSFQGLPRPGKRDGKRERNCYFEGWNKGDIEKVVKIFKKLGVSLENVKIIAGWFDSTLSAADINTIAVLHIDADWYNSVKVVLEKLYEKVVPGGFVVVDDYWLWQGCREAVKDYIKEHKIEGIVMKKIESAVYFQKPMQDGK